MHLVKDVDMQPVSHKLNLRNIVSNCNIRIELSRRLNGENNAVNIKNRLVAQNNPNEHKTLIVMI